MTKTATPVIDHVLERAKTAFDLMGAVKQREVIDLLERMRVEKIEGAVKHTDPHFYQQAHGYGKAIDDIIDLVTGNDSYDVDKERRKRRREGRV